MSEIRPFLASLAHAGGTRPFGSALRVHETPPGTSPWSPQPSGEPATAAPAIDLTSLREEAVAQGREEGLRETAALRARLQQMIFALGDAEIEAAAVNAGLIADAAATVVDAWIGGTGAAEKFLPIVRAWQARGSEPATAHVAPSEVEAVREAIGDAEITVVADPALAAGVMRVSSPGLELTHSWEQRLVELREAIAAAVEVSA